MNAKQSIITIVATICMTGCTPKSTPNYHFVPIENVGVVYAYYSAMRYGLAGGHDRIIVLRDTNQMDTNYFFYRDHLYYKVTGGHLEIVLSDFPTSKDRTFNIEGIDVRLLNSLDYWDFESNHEKNGYSIIKTSAID